MRLMKSMSEQNIHAEKQAKLISHTRQSIPQVILDCSTSFINCEAGVFAAGWIEVSCWILTGERQTAVIRSNYVQVLLNQDMSFFDTYGNNGDIFCQVLSDVLLTQVALSEKIGNYIRNMATFFSGLAIGLINCWQIALITLATGPFIVAAGGISNIFLYRLAENIQDTYAEVSIQRKEPMISEFDFRNEYNTISNNAKEIHGRVVSSTDHYHYARNTTHDTQ